MLTFLDASGETVSSRISVLFEAPFKWPHVGHDVSSTGVENVEGWMKKHDFEALYPLRVSRHCSGWNRLGPRTEARWDDVVEVKYC
jgi:hypothetical protein